MGAGPRGNTVAWPLSGSRAGGVRGGARSWVTGRCQAESRVWGSWWEGRIRLRAGLNHREWAEPKRRAELTEVIFLVNPAHDVGPAGRVLCAAAVLQLSHEASTYWRLLSLLGLFQDVPVLPGGAGLKQGHRRVGKGRDSGSPPPRVPALCLLPEPSPVAPTTTMSLQLTTDAPSP